MPSKLQAELIRFHRFISDRLGQGAGDLSPEEALDLWRAENPSPDEHAEAVAALREAIADMKAGDSGQPLEEFDREFRERRGLGPGR
ncbi:MAG: hypothetical protein HY721_29645 [Planctomycetes bacterium]|nr:hypothetical protein [Planctomycetota bacterium]